MGRPIKTIKSGKVEISAWENNFDNQKSYSYSFQKSYKGKDDKWQNTNFFTLNDLYDLRNLIDHAMHGKIKEKGLETPSRQNEGNSQQALVTQVFDGDVPF